MLLRLLTVVLSILLGMMFISQSFAQDSKKEIKKETKPAVVNDSKKEVKKETKPAVAGDSKKDSKKPSKPPTMKFVSCTQPGCGFWAKSHSRKELQSMMKRHSKRHHKIELTDKQLKEMVKVEGTK